MSETFFETAQAILTGYDTALSKQWREEDRAWRKEDLAWREREKYYNETNLNFIEEERIWRLEDMDQRLLDNIRVLWQRFVDRTRSDVEERSEQLKGISSLSALVAGFAVSGFLQFNIEQGDGTWGTFMAFGVSTALVVALMMNAMMTCSLIQASILKTGRKFVAEAEEAAFVQDCLDWYKTYSPGKRPPAPPKTFTKHWNAQCEGEWVRAFAMFSAGVPVFFFNLAVAGWIKFNFAQTTAIGITVVMGLALAYFMFSQFRWVAHLLEKHKELDVASTYSGNVCRLPFDWHLPPEPFVRRRHRASRTVSALSEATSRMTDASDMSPSPAHHTPSSPPRPDTSAHDAHLERQPSDMDHVFDLHRAASSFTTMNRASRLGGMTRQGSIPLHNIDEAGEGGSGPSRRYGCNGQETTPPTVLRQANESNSSDDEEGEKNVAVRVGGACRRLVTRMQSTVLHHAPSFPSRHGSTENRRSSLDRHRQEESHGPKINGVDDV